MPGQEIILAGENPRPSQDRSAKVEDKLLKSMLFLQNTYPIEYQATVSSRFVDGNYLLTLLVYSLAFCLAWCLSLASR